MTAITKCYQLWQLLQLFLHFISTSTLLKYFIPSARVNSLSAALTARINLLSEALTAVTNCCQLWQLLIAVGSSTSTSFQYQNCLNIWFHQQGSVHSFFSKVVTSIPRGREFVSEPVSDICRLWSDLGPMKILRGQCCLSYCIILHHQKLPLCFLWMQCI